MLYAIWAVAGLIVGGIICWLLASSLATKKSFTRLEEAERKANTAEGTVLELRREIASADKDFDTLRSNLSNEQAAKVKAETQLSETIQRLSEEHRLLEDAKTKLTDAFKAIAGDTLNASTTQFLKLAKEAFDKVLEEAKGDLGKRQEAISGLVKPLSESMNKFEEHVQAVEKARVESYAGLAEQIKTLSTAQQQLQRETGNLVTALRRPEIRGRWGELTLHRVVELAGMSEHCDFCEQVSTNTDEGRMRPDLVVYLPAEREIVVDSKVPLDAYLDADKADTEEKRKDAMNRHAKQVRGHMNGLADKSYWAQFTKAPEFVVMFIPGESFFGAALDADKSLIEDALERRVIMATPTTLIALIRAVAYGWRQEQVAKNTQEISNLGRTLYERMGILARYIADVGKELERTNAAYNKAVGSLESRIFPAARQFRELGVASGEEIPTIENIQNVPRTLLQPDVQVKQDEK